jgi:serine/threonine-protein kinase RsbW
MHVVSAVGEAYNNIVLHGYAGREPGSIQLTIENCPGCVRVVIKDTGASFDPSQSPPPDLDALPVSGLGIFVMRSMVDELSYVAGATNVLTLVKRVDGPGETDVGAKAD